MNMRMACLCGLVIAVCLSATAVAQTENDQCKQEAKKLADQILLRDKDALSLSQLKDDIKQQAEGAILDRLKEQERMLSNQIRVRDNKIKKLASEVKTLCEEVEEIEDLEQL